MAGRAVALLPCASGPSSWWRRIGYRWLTPSCCGVWSPAGGLFPGRPGVFPLGPVSRIIPLTEVSGMATRERKGHMWIGPGFPSARFSVSRDASTGRQHPRCSSVRPLPARASPLEPDQARRISAAGDRVARPCVRGSRTGSEGSETAAEGPLRWRLGSRRGRIGRGSRRAWARCQDVGRIGGGRPGRPRGPAGGVGGTPGGRPRIRDSARGARGGVRVLHRRSICLCGFAGVPPGGVGEGLRWNGTPEQKETRGPEGGTSS